MVVKIREFRSEGSGPRSHAISKGHERLPESGLTRLPEQLKRNATMIANIIASDLRAVSPEYTETFEIDSKVSLKILKTYSIPKEIIKADSEDFSHSWIRERVITTWMMLLNLGQLQRIR
jgi:hypothetical protein